MEWALSFAFLSALSLVAWNRVRGLGRALDLSALVFLHVFLTGGLVMVSGLLGAFTAHKLAGISAAGLIVLAAWKRSRLFQAWFELRRLFLPILSFARGHPIHAGAFALVLGLIGLRMAVNVWFFPPYVWDVLTYHLPKVAEWVQHGNLRVPPLPVNRVFFPGGFELLQAWWCVFSHGDAVVEMPGLFFYALACMSVFAVSRQLRVGLRAAAWSMVVFGLTPVLALNAVSCKNDVAIAGIFLYLIALWCRPVPPEAAGKRWLLSFAAVGMGIGIKPTLAFILPGLLWILPLGLRRDDFRALRRIRVERWTLALLLLACLLGGYWYVRNWLCFGNPLYPVALGGAGGGWQPQQGGIFMSSGIESMRQLFALKIFDGELGNPDVSDATGWGWFMFVCGWPTVVYSLFASRKFRWLAAGLWTSLFLLLCCTIPDPWNMRYVPWMPALGVWGFFAAGRCLRPPVWKTFALLAVWTTALNGLGSALPYGVKLDPHAVAADRSWKPRFQRYLDERIPPGETVAIFGGGDDWIYLVYGPSFARSVHWLEEAGDLGFAEAMKARKLRYLCRVPSGHGSWMPPRLEDDLRQGTMTAMEYGLFRLVDGEENRP